MTGTGRSSIRTVDLLSDDDQLAQVLMELDPVLAHLATGECTLRVAIHSKVKHYNFEITSNRGITLVNEDGCRVIGRVVSLVEAAVIGRFFVVYQQYESGLIDNKYVVTSSLTRTEHAVEFGTEQLTFLTNILPREKEDISVVVF